MISRLTRSAALAALPPDTLRPRSLIDSLTSSLVSVRGPSERRLCACDSAGQHSPAHGVLQPRDADAVLLAPQQPHEEARVLSRVAASQRSNATRRRERRGGEEQATAPALPDLVLDVAAVQEHAHYVHVELKVTHQPVVRHLRTPAW